MLSYMKTTSRDKSKRIWYGVAAVCDGEVEKRYDGLTTDGASIDRLITLLNKEKASAIHLPDIVDDYLACMV